MTERQRRRHNERGKEKQTKESPFGNPLRPPPPPNPQPHPARTHTECTVITENAFQTVFWVLRMHARRMERGKTSRATWQ